MTELVQITLTVDQVRLLDGATQFTLNDSPDLTPPVQDALYDLRDFLQAVADNPRAWIPSGRMAESLKRRARREKHPLTARNDGTTKGTERYTSKRKKRQAERASYHKHRRKNRAALAAEHNRARQEEEDATGIVAQFIHRFGAS